jgi:pimeloyl-ACP methyl ester carboxylesterase
MNMFGHQSGTYLQIGNAKIYYEIAGNINGLALLVLHGGFGNNEDLNDILPGLAHNFKLIGIDSRGHGMSTMGDEKLSYQLIQEDVEKVLALLGIDELSIIGFSDGGIVAYRLAAFSKLKINRVITIGSRWHHKNALETKEILTRITPESWKEKFPWMYDSYQKLNPKPDFDKLMSAVINMWLDTGPTGHPNEHVDNINCPVLISRGDQDHLVSRECVFELAEHIKNASLLNVPFAGHAAFKDQKEIFGICVNKFFEATR